MGRFFRSTKGTTAIEYGIMAAGIALSIVVALNLVGDGVKSNFDEMAQQLSDIAPAAGGDVPNDPCQVDGQNCGEN